VSTAQKFYGQLNPKDMLGIYRVRGAWAASTSYLLGDMVRVGTSTYEVLVDHVSAAVFDEASGSAAGGTMKLVRIVTDAAGDIPFRITGAASQSANMLEVLNNAGAARFLIGPAGQLTVATGNTDAIAATLNALAGTTADLQRWQIDGTTLAFLSAAGILTARGVRATTVAPAVPALVATGAASQTANIAEVRNSAAAALFVVAADGTTTLSPTATGAALVVNSPTATPAATAVVAAQVAGTTVAALRADGALVGRQAAIAPVADVVPVTVKAGTASAASDLQQWQASGGTVMASVSGAGLLTSRGQVTAPTTDIIPSVNRSGVSSAAADIEQWQDNAGTILARMSAGGLITSRGQVTAPTTDIVPSINRAGIAGATANLEQWQSSTGAVLARLDRDGQLREGRRPVTTNTFNGSGQLTRQLVTDGAATPRTISDTTLTYDGSGNLSTVAVIGGGRTLTRTYTYDANGNPATITETES
jgi:hypothetical protein